MIEDVRSLVGEPTESFFLDTEIGRWLNEGQEVFSTETKILPSYYSHTLTAGDIFNDREIRLSSDFLALDEGGVLYDSVPLKQMSRIALAEWAGKWGDDTGTPTSFYIRGDAIGFYPKPSAGSIVEYYGIERAPDLSGSQAPFSGDYRVIAFRRYIRDYALALCWEKKNEMAKSQAKMMNFEHGMAIARQIVTGNQNQGSMIIPGYRSQGNKYSVRWGRTDVYD